MVFSESGRGSGPGNCEIMQGNIQGSFLVGGHKFDVRPVMMSCVFSSSHVWVQRCRISRELDLTGVHVLSRSKRK